MSLWLLYVRHNKRVSLCEHSTLFAKKKDNVLREISSISQGGLLDVEKYLWKVWGLHRYWDSALRGLLEKDKLNCRGERDFQCLVNEGFICSNTFMVATLLRNKENTPKNVLCTSLESRKYYRFYCNLVVVLQAQPAQCGISSSESCGQHSNWRWCADSGYPQLFGAALPAASPSITQGIYKERGLLDNI